MPLRNLISIILVITIIILATLRLMESLSMWNNSYFRGVILLVFLFLGIILVYSAIKKLKKN